MFDIFRGAVFFCLALLVASCGGGGSDELPPSRPIGTAAGKAQHGPIINATISGYAWDGAKGLFISSTTSDSEGRYVLDVDASSTFMMIESQGGNYQDEATGRSVSMGSDGLKAVILYELGQAVDVQLTYFTHLAACRAEYLVGSGINVGNAIVQANNEFSAIIGESITGVEPVDATKTTSLTPFMTPAHRYGIAISAVSLAVDTLRQESGNILGDEIYTVKYFTNLGCKDIMADGMLNGIAEATPGNPTGQLYLGNTALNTESYRRLLARSVVEFGSHPNNKTGLDSDNLLSMANSISKSASNLFGGVEGESVDNEAPTIVATLAEGTLLAGTVDIQFDIQDPLGVNAVDFYLNGVLFAVGQPNNPVMRINTALYADGDHEIAVVASDVLGNTSPAIGAATTFTYRFINTGADVAFSSPTLVNSTAYTATGTFVDNGAGIDRIEVNGVDAVVMADTDTWSADITLEGGQSTVTAIIYDSLGNSAQTDYLVKVDLFDPVVNSEDTRVDFSDYSGLLNLCETRTINSDTPSSQPICLNAERISLDGLPVNRGLIDDGYIVLGVTFSDPQGQGAFSNPSDILVEYQALLNGEIIRDWSTLSRPVDPSGNPIANRVWLPVTTEFFGENFYQVGWSDVFTVNIMIKDQAGNTSNLDFDFTLDVIVPIVAVTTNINDTLLATTSYDDRDLVNGADVEISYSYNNDSSLPYLISLNLPSNHGLTHQYKSAVRENMARVITETQWKGYFVRSSKGCMFFCDPRYYLISSLVALNESIYPADPIVPQFTRIYSNTVFVPVPSTAWVNKPPCGAEELRVRGTGLMGPNSFWYGWEHPEYPGNFACSNETNPDGTAIAFLQERKVQMADYANGYPRNVFSDFETTSSVINESIKVINEAQGVEIFPLAGGWYRIPPRTPIKIVRVVELPRTTLYTDNRVTLNDETVPYSLPIYQDTQMTYDLDTTLDITRAIDPGSFEQINDVSQTTTVEGEGVKTYSFSIQQ